MTLRRWMNEAGFTTIKLAEILDVSRQHVHFLLTRQRGASVHLVRQIEAITKGQVTAKELERLV